MNVASFIVDARKFVVSAAVGVAGIVGQILAANLATGTALHYLQVILAIATAIAASAGVYQANNGETQGTVVAVEPNVTDVVDDPTVLDPSNSI